MEHLGSEKALTAERRSLGDLKEETAAVHIPEQLSGHNWKQDAEPLVQFRGCPCTKLEGIWLWRQTISLHQKTLTISSPPPQDQDLKMRLANFSRSDAVA